jgi:hypothetical protein
MGKSPMFVASRRKLTDLVPKAVEAFYADEGPRLSRGTMPALRFAETS